MSTYLLTEAAKRDLQEIHAYIAYESRQRADSVLRRIMHAMRDLAATPWLGKKRDDLTDLNVRFYRVLRYHIIHLPDSQPLRIIRVLDTSRDVGSILDEP